MDLKFPLLLNVALLLIIPINCDTSSNADSVSLLFGKKCDELLMHYALLSGNFTKCFIQHARPITVCQSCVDNYIQVNESHRNITKLKEDTGEACKQELINVDRLEVIEGNFKYVTDQWKLASCLKCYDSKTVLNSNTKEILKLHSNLDDCVREHGSANVSCNETSEVCTECVNQYLSLNDFYDTHDSYNGFCMDIVDMMNTTRFNWSSSYCCCTDRRKPEPLYVAFYFSLLLMPVIFYFVMWYRSTSAVHEITYYRRWTDRRASFSNRQARSSSDRPANRSSDRPANSSFDRPAGSSSERIT